MNVKKIDLIWAAVSMFIVGYSYYRYLLFGIVAVYMLMAAVCFRHIIRIKNGLRNSSTVYGTVTDYFRTKKAAFLPHTEIHHRGGRAVTSLYGVIESAMRSAVRRSSAMTPMTPCSSALQAVRTSSQGLFRYSSSEASSRQ